MSRFDQDPDAPYGRCLNCEATFADRAAMDAHMHETFEAGGRINGNGHSTTASNATRAERIRWAVQQKADDALENALNEFVDGLASLQRREDVSDEEITAAVAGVYGDPDWAEAWSESL